MPAPDDARLDAFWQVAKRQARLSHLPGYFGPSPLESVTPPAWAFADAPDQADELLAMVLAGATTATSTPLADYEVAEEALPEVGTLGIVVDGSGVPRALLVTTDVRVLPAGEVDVDGVLGEGGLDPAMPVVLERFEVLYSD